MPTATGVYLGELRTENTHVHSGQKLITDAPLDNQGMAESFSPTDLVVSALSDCIMTIMGIAARSREIDITGAYWEVTKVMASNPRRISEIFITYSFPKNGYTDKQKELLEAVAKTCPVALSLHPEIRQHVTFNW